MVAARRGAAVVQPWTVGSGNVRRIRRPKEPPAKLPFDSKILLTRIGDGRTIIDYTRGQIIFAQGDPADAIFYIQKGKAKPTVVSKPGHGSSCENGQRR